MRDEHYGPAEAYRTALLVIHVHATTGRCLNCTAVGCPAASWALEMIVRVSAERERARMARIQEAK